MRVLVAVVFGGSLLAGLPVSGAAQAPSVGDVFKNVIPSVAVIRANGSEVSARTVA